MPLRFFPKETSLNKILWVLVHLGLGLSFVCCGFSLFQWFCDYRQAVAVQGEFLLMTPVSAFLQFLLAVCVLIGGRKAWFQAVASLLSAAIFLGITLLLAEDFFTRAGARPLGVAASANQVITTLFGAPLPMISRLSLVFGAQTAMSCVLILSPLSRHGFPRKMAKFLSAMSVILGIMVASAYSAGIAMMYDAENTPVSWLSALSLTGINIALLARGGIDSWDRFSEKYQGSSRHLGTLRGFEKRLLLFIGLLSAAIAAAGFGYLRHQQNIISRDNVANLESIADIKVQQITAWLNERYGEVRFMMKAPAVARDFQAFLEAPEDRARREVAMQWLQVMKDGARYDSLSFFDRNLKVLLSTDATGHEWKTIVEQSLLEAMSDGLSRFVDFQRSASGRVRLHFIAPVRQLGEGPDGTSPILGAVLFTVDPAQALYPLIQSWPSPSVSAETLIGRREGNIVLYLNEFRHRDIKPLLFRLSINQSELPMAKIARGEISSHGGVDYRSVPVLYATRQVPSTPWLLVVKIDQAEVFMNLQREAWSIALLVCALLAAAGFAAGLVWRQSTADFLMHELRMEQRSRELAARLALLSRHANDIILITDDTWCILDANQRACEAYGYSLSDLLGRNLHALASPGGRSSFELGLRSLRSSQKALFETEHIRADGTVFPVEFSGRLVEAEGRLSHLAIIRDISLRKLHEREIERLNKMYAALSEVNQLMVRTTDVDELLSAACSALVKVDGMSLVWIGRYDRTQNRLLPVARDGVEQSFLDGIELKTDVPPELATPSVVAVTEARADFSHDLTDSRMVQWRETLRRHRFHSCAAFPLRRQGVVWGNLTVYTSDSGSLAEAERNLLGETANDLSYAMDVLDDRLEHRRTEEGLRQSELRFRTLFENVNEVVVLHELLLDESGRAQDYRILDCNDSFEREMHIPRLRAKGALASALWGMGRAPYLIEYASVVENGLPLRLESFLEPLGKYFSTSVVSMGGRQFATVSSDITERKHVEEVLRQSALQWQSTFDAVSDAVFLLDGEAKIVQCNKSALSLLGKDRESVLGKVCWENVHDRTGPVPECPLAKMRQSRAREQSELRLKGRWFEVTVDPVFESSGVLKGAVHILSDITERKKAEAALLESEQRYRRFTQALTDYVYSVELNKEGSTLTRHGAGCLAVTGWTPEELQSDPYLWLRMILDQDRQMVLDQVDRILADKEATAIDHRIMRKDGVIRWVRNTPSVHRDSQGRILGYDGLIQDITERKIAEQALRDANFELQTINRAISVCAASLDLKSVEEVVLEHALRVSAWDAGLIFLCQKGAAVNVVAQKGVPEERRDGAAIPLAQSQLFSEAVRQSLRSEDLSLVELEPAAPARMLLEGLGFKRARSLPLVFQGECISVLCLLSRGIEPLPLATIRLLETLTGPFALSIQNALLHAETLRYATQMEQLVKGRTSELEATNRELEAFTYSVSHDLRAPLRAIDGFSRILLEDYAEALDDEGRRILNVVCKESQRMGRLIDDLLAFSRLGRHALQRQTVDMGDIVQEVRDELMARDPERRVEWVIHELPKAHFDPSFLRQVWVNLLSNSLKYSRNRDLARIEIGGEQYQQETRFWVKDNGAGFDMKYANKLFGVFQRLHSDAEFEGNGVGLALVQRIIHRHGGRVWAEAALGQGATFFISLPDKEATESQNL